MQLLKGSLQYSAPQQLSQCTLICSVILWYGMRICPDIVCCIVVVGSRTVHAKMCRIWKQELEENEIPSRSNLDLICYAIYFYTHHLQANKNLCKL